MNDGWLKVQFDPNVDEVYFTSSTPFITDFGAGEVSSVFHNGAYIYNFGPEAEQALTQSKVLKIRPSTGDTFGSMLIMGNILSWGGNKFDITASEPAALSTVLNIYKSFGITDSNTVLALSGDYSQAGEPAITNGIFHTF